MLGNSQRGRPHRLFSLTRSVDEGHQNSHVHAFNTTSKRPRSPSNQPGPAAKAPRRDQSVTAAERGEDSGDTDKWKKSIKWGTDREEAAFTFIEENEQARAVLGGGGGVNEGKAAMKKSDAYRMIAQSVFRHDEMYRDMWKEPTGDGQRKLCMSTDAWWRRIVKKYRDTREHLERTGGAPLLALSSSKDVDALDDQDIKEATKNAIDTTPHYWRLLKILGHGDPLLPSTHPKSPDTPLDLGPLNPTRSQAIERWRAMNPVASWLPQCQNPSQASAARGNGVLEGRAILGVSREEQNEKRSTAVIRMPESRVFSLAQRQSRQTKTSTVGSSRKGQLSGRGPGRTVREDSSDTDDDEVSVPTRAAYSDDESDEDSSPETRIAHSQAVSALYEARRSRIQARRDLECKQEHEERLRELEAENVREAEKTKRCQAKEARKRYVAQARADVAKAKLRTEHLRIYDLQKREGSTNAANLKVWLEENGL
ncbi:hypothetical protein JCM5296_001080 [Sporobolomyces johnsonii]